jgi:Ca-activated chloride channel family protein
MNTEILLDHEPVADGGYLVRALLRITGEAPGASDRPPLNLGLVLDRSGSMAALGKLERAKEAAALLVRRLRDDDTVAIVAYDDEVRTVAGRTRGEHREALLERIAPLGPGGTTNLSGGWLRGRELVAEEPVDGGVNRVILLTDGLANVGITDPGRLRDLVATAAAKGVSTTTIGFGADYDERLLREMADAGRGSTYYIEAPDQAPQVFEAEIEGLMALAAQNVAVILKPAPAVNHATVLHQYPSQRAGDGSLRLELGDLYALEPRSLLVEFLLTSDDDAAEVDVAILTLEGHVLLADGGVEKRTVTLPIRVERSGAAVVNPEVRREAVLLEAARARQEALEDRARGRFEDGARKLREAAGRLACPEVDLDADLQDELDDLTDLAARFEEAEVSAADAKYMHQRMYSRAMSKESAMESVRAAREAARRKRRER